jgi:tetratricopeptide (TPR) repeat protein
LGETLRQEGDLTEALTQVEAVLAQQPDHYQGLQLRGKINAAQGNGTAARADYQRLIELAPENPSGYYHLGLLARVEQRYDEAIAYFDKALQLNPKLMDVFTNKVLTLGAQKKWADARDACAQQLKAVADSPSAQAIIYFMEGQINKSSGDLAAAKTDFQQALEANPNYVLAYYELARLYLKDKDVDSAVAQFEALLAKNPRQYGVHMQLGTIHDLNERPDLAETHYRKALEINPDFAPAANNLAYNLAEQGKSLDEALTLAQKAREKLPEDPGVMDTLGWVYTKKGLYDSGIREFQDSLTKLSDNATIHYHLGVAYAGKGDKENARMAFNKALETKGAEAIADQVKQAMASL